MLSLYRNKFVNNVPNSRVKTDRLGIRSQDPTKFVQRRDADGPIAWSQFMNS